MLLADLSIFCSKRKIALYCIDQKIYWLGKGGAAADIVIADEAEHPSLGKHSRVDD